MFSSTAAVYGEPGVPLIDETLPLAPINPYGASKMMAERILADIAGAAGLRYVILRYFNVAGADLEGRIGEATPNNSHLIKVACEAAIGIWPGMRDQRRRLSDAGWHLRARLHSCRGPRGAHIEALRYLERGGGSEVFNCGYGHGFSVREVIDAVARVSASRLADRGGRRGGRAIRRRWSRATRRSARCSAGSHGTTTSRSSCAAPGSGSSGCRRRAGRTRWRPPGQQQDLSLGRGSAAGRNLRPCRRTSRGDAMCFAIGDAVVDVIVDDDDYRWPSVSGE